MKPKVVHVFTKKMLKTQYHLAEFNKPLTQGNKLPDHIIEKPAEEMDRLSNAGL